MVTDHARTPQLHQLPNVVGIYRDKGARCPPPEESFPSAAPRCPCTTSNTSPLPDRLFSTALPTTAHVKYPHINQLYRDAREARYPCHAAGNTLLVSKPNRDQSTALFRSEWLLITSGSTRYLTARSHVRSPVPALCAHFYLNHVCNLGAECGFIHYISVDPTAVLGQQPKQKCLPPQLLTSTPPPSPIPSNFNPLFPDVFRYFPPGCSPDSSISMTEMCEEFGSINSADELTLPRSPQGSYDPYANIRAIMGPDVFRL